jgi:hypothetical protein
MKFRKVTFIVFALGCASLGTLHGKSKHKKVAKDVTSNINDAVLFQSGMSQIVKDSLKIIEDGILGIFSYFTTLADAGEKFLAKNGPLPVIQCAKCKTQQLECGMFSGHLIAESLKRFGEIPDGFENLEKIKSTLDEFLKTLNEGSFTNIEDFMIRLSNEIKPHCRQCNGPSDSWEKATQTIAVP